MNFLIEQNNLHTTGGIMKTRSEAKNKNYADFSLLFLRILNFRTNMCSAAPQLPREFPFRLLFLYHHSTVFLGLTLNFLH